MAYLKAKRTDRSPRAVLAVHALAIAVEVEE